MLFFLVPHKRYSYNINANTDICSHGEQMLSPNKSYLNIPYIHLFMTILIALANLLSFLIYLYFDVSI